MTLHGPSTRSVFGIVLKIAGVLLALYLVRDEWNDRDHAAMKTSMLEKELDEKQRLAASLSDYAEQLQEMQTMLAPLVRRLPAKLDRPKIESALHDQAADAGIEIVSVRWDAESVREGFYTEVPASVVVQGSMAGYAKFMDVMLRDSPLRIVTAMKLTPIDGNATVRAAMSVHYFRYLDEFE